MKAVPFSEDLSPDSFLLPPLAAARVALDETCVKRLGLIVNLCGKNPTGTCGLFLVVL